VAGGGNHESICHRRQWLGIVPGEYTTGGKQKLLGISKRGNSYLRRLFVQGARAVLQQRAKQSSGLSAWLAQLTTRTHSNVAAVALANKLARMAWAVLAKLQHDWPADDAWLRPGLEIAFAIPTSTDQRRLRS
jgi:hypothetical protein